MTRFHGCTLCGESQADCLCKNYWQGEVYSNQGDPRPHASIFPHGHHQHLHQHGLEHSHHNPLNQVQTIAHLSSLSQVPAGLHGGHAQLTDVSSLSPPIHDSRTMTSMAYPPSSHSHPHGHGHNHGLSLSHSPKPSPYSVNGLSLSTPNVDLLHTAMGYQNDMF
ncbi:unnamed protein product, partial [Candidula unifasciata]